MLVRDGSSQSDGNHLVFVKAPLENGLLSSKRAQLWFSHCPKKGLKASMRMWFCLMHRSKEPSWPKSYLCQIWWFWLLHRKMTPNRPQKRPPGASKSSSALQKTSHKPRALAKQKRLAASRGFQEPQVAKPKS